jgi:hypothetical protein
MGKRFTGVLGKVTGVLKRMAFSDASELPDNHLLVMNLPPLIARRDAAYARAVELLQSQVFSLSDEDRCYLYEIILELLEITIEITERLIPIRQGKVQVPPILEYLSLLKKIIEMTSSFADYSTLILKEEDNLRKFLGTRLSGQFYETEQIISDSEVNIYQNITELITVAAPAMERIQLQNKRTFTKVLLERYQRSLEEHQKYFNTFRVKNRKNSISITTTTGIKRQRRP